MKNLNAEKQSSRNLRANVRFTEKEFQRIDKEARQLDVSIPSLLKDAYFRQSEKRILMESHIAKSILTELRRIGNNHNQIARKLNSGFEIDGFDNPIEETFKGLRKMYSYISNYGAVS